MGRLNHGRRLCHVGWGDLDPQGLEVFELQFDEPLRDLQGVDPDTVAVLQDLGPSGSCSGSGEAGFPRRLEVEVELTDQGARLLVRPRAPLPSGHNYRLELQPQGLVSASDPTLTIWESSPRTFDFATRDVPGEVVGTIDDATFPFGDVTDALSLITLSEG